MLNLDAKLTSFSPYVLSLFRIVFGLLLTIHATQKLFAWPVGTPAEDGTFTGPAVPIGMWPFWWGGLIEIVVGLLLLTGLVTRLAAFVGSGAMAFAYFTEHQPTALWPIENGVIRGAADVGPRPGGDRLHDGHPPSGGHDEHAGGRDQVQRAVAPTRRGGKQIRRGEAGKDQEALQHLGQERRTHHGSDDHQPPPRRRGDRAGQAVRGDHHQQHQKRIGIVEAEHQRRCGGARQDRTGHDPGDGALRAARDRPSEGGEQHRDRRTPIRACGTSTDQLFMPKSRTESPVTQSAPGGLSTVMKPRASSAPKNHADQL